VPTLEELRERINLRLEESFVSISEQVGDLAPADLVELLNQLNLIEAASVMTMLPVSRAVELIDLPTMRRRSAILEKLDPGAPRRSLRSSLPTNGPTSSSRWG
jgi:Mg/Co/Ni transporter MgtE